MRHKAIESMMRIQYQIPENIDVNIKFISLIGDEYEFSAEWWIESTMHFVTLKLTYKHNEKDFGEDL